MAEAQLYWYAARTRDKHELSIRDRLVEMGITHFLPTRVEVRQLKTRRRSVEVPVVRNLIFVNATKQEAIDLANQYGIPLFYIQDRVKRSMLVIPDKQMQDFMRVFEVVPDALLEEMERMVPGERVKIMKGDLAGIEGRITSDANQTYVVIQLHDLLHAKIKINKSYLKIIE